MSRLPESPRWLVSKARYEKAFKTLSFTRCQTEAKQELELMRKHSHKSSTHWHELINKQHIAALLLAVSITILNQFTGINTFLQYAPQMLADSGMHSAVNGMASSMVVGIMNFICTVIAIGLVDRIGRRKLLITGTLGVCVTEIVMALISHLATPHPWLQVAGLISFIIFFAIGPGVVVWLAISELLPTNIRSKGMAVCLFASSLSGTLLASMFPLLMTKIGLSGTYMICAGFSLVYFYLAFRHMPETNAKNLEEIVTNLAASQPNMESEAPA